MFDHRAGALALADFAPFSMPPNRPNRSERKTDSGQSSTSLMQAIGDEVMKATEEPWIRRAPRLSNYPY